MSRSEGVLWLDEVAGEPAASVGPKAARLAALRRAGAPVLDGFCLPAAVGQRFLAAPDLASLVADLEARLARGLADAELRGHAERLRAAIAARELPPGLAAELARALATLDPRPTARFAVRSSAAAEDLADASFAGQLESYLAVPAAAVPLAVRRCWASRWTERAIRYRQRAGRGLGITDASDARGAVAVLIQPSLDCDVAGVAFTVHPLTGAEEVVVEAVWGLGEALAQGEVSPDRYALDAASLAETRPAQLGDKARRRVSDPAGGTRLVDVPAADRRRRALTAAQLAELGRVVRDLEAQLGEPQDVEWGFAGGRLHVFQSRPVTGRPAAGDESRARESAPAPGPASVYTDLLPDERCWTSGFLEERFPEPLSPLGWSAVRESFEAFALRDPLRYLGCDDFAGRPLTRLYQGHPYVDAEVFRRLYKLFPDSLLPEDAWRYFPGGDAAWRLGASLPRSALDPHLWLALLRAWARDPGNWSPLYNHVEWERFVPRYDAAVAAVDAAGRSADLPQLLALTAKLDQVNGRLLRIHRWSLTHADILYTLLRRLARAWVGPSYGRVCADLVSDLSDRSLEMDTRLRALAAQAARLPATAAALRAGGSVDELAAHLRGDAAGSAFVAAVRRFVADYGHRSLSLDILRPSFAADTRQVVRLLAALLDAGAPREQQRRREAALRHARRAILGAAPPLGPLRWTVFRQVLGLTQSYVRLREDQRFYWQKGLAALRRLYLGIGEGLAAAGALATPDDVFYLLRSEVEAAARAADRRAPALRELAAGRRAEHAALCAERARSPDLAYPRFLRGNRPLEAAPPRPAGERLVGQPVSPGRVRGPVRVVRTPESLPDLEPGEILVTRGADPGWTPLFGKIGGLVMECGGQLSHGSVVAREYGIPAVVGVLDATSLLRDGERVLVDGEAGTVERSR